MRCTPTDVSRPPYKQTPPYGARWIDYGLLAFEVSVLSVEGAEIGDVCHRLAQARRLAGYPVHRRFYEIGTPEALAETDAFLVRARAEGDRGTT